MNRKIVLIILGLFFFVPLIWFHKNLIIIGGDFAYNFTPLHTLKLYLYQWNETVGTGLNNARVIPQLFPYQLALVIGELAGLSAQLREKVLFGYLFGMSAFSMYFLAITVFRHEKEREVIGLASAAMYALSPYARVLVWPNPTSLLFFYAHIPLLLAVTIRGLSGGKLWLHTIQFSLVATIMNFAFVNQAFLITAWALIGLYFLYYIVCEIYDPKKIRRALLFFLLMSLYWLLTNIWWLYPFLYSVMELYRSALYIPDRLILETSSRATSIKNLYMLDGYWAFTENFKGDQYYPYSGIYQTIFFKLISFIPAILFSLSFLFRKKNINFFIIVGILSILFIKGLHPPLIEISNYFIDHVPFSASFRNPLEKVGTILILSFAVINGFVVSKLFTSIRGKYGSSKANAFTIGILILITLYAWPLFSNQVFSSGGKVIPSWHVQVPDYYDEANKWLNSQKDTFRIFSLPFSDINSVAFSWPNGYFGSDFSAHIFSKPVISQSINELTNIIGQKISTESATAVTKVLGLMNVKYVMVHNDAKFEYFGTPKYDGSELISEGKMSLVKSIGLLDFYQIPDHFFVPKIYVTDNVATFSGKIADIFKLVELSNYDPKTAIVADKTSSLTNLTKGDLPQITFQKINPIKYVVKIEEATSPFLLVFSDSYSTEWKLYPSKKQHKFSENQNDSINFINKTTFETIGEKPVFEEQHFMVDGYANGWLIDPNKVGDKSHNELIIEYFPQRRFYFAIIVSIVSIMMGTIFIILSLLYGYKHGYKNKIT